VIICAAAYKGARLKIDDLYAYNFKGGNKKGGVASLLSNIMYKGVMSYNAILIYLNIFSSFWPCLFPGLDNQHSHGLELPGASNDSDDDDDRNTKAESGVHQDAGKEAFDLEERKRFKIFFSFFFFYTQYCYHMLIYDAENFYMKKS